MGQRHTGKTFDEGFSWQLRLPVHLQRDRTHYRGQDSTVGYILDAVLL